MKKNNLTKEEHNKETQLLLAEVNLKSSSPTPWELYWDGFGLPIIYDSKGNVVATLSTGTLNGAYKIDTIIANAKRLLIHNT